MSLDAEDKEWFIQNVELAVLKGVQPTKEKADRLDTTVFGATGDNGLNADMKDVQKDIKSINKRIYTFTGAITGMGMLLHVVYDNFIKGGK